MTILSDLKPTRTIYKKGYTVAGFKISLLSKRNNFNCVGDLCQKISRALTCLRNYISEESAFQFKFMRSVLGAEQTSEIFPSLMTTIWSTWGRKWIPCVASKRVYQESNKHNKNEYTNHSYLNCRWVKVSWNDVK